MTVLTTAERTTPWMKSSEFPVHDLPDPAAPTVPGATVLETLVPLSAAVERVRSLFDRVMADGADQAVVMQDLAAVLEQANQLERAASALTIAATAGYARREQHDDLADRSVLVESIRARGFVHEWTAQELGHLLRISSRTADSRVSDAADLASVMPHTLAAVSAGSIEAWQATKLLAFLRQCGADDETVRVVDEWLAGRLATTDPSRLIALVRYALGRIRPELLPERAAQARERRAIEKWEIEPGLTEITARMPTHQAAAIWSAATDLARTYLCEDPELSMDRARLDAFVDLALSNVAVKTTVSLGVPVVTSAYARAGEAPVPLRDPEAPPPGDDHPDWECRRGCDCWADGCGDGDARADEGGPVTGQPERVPDWAAHPDSDPTAAAPGSAAFRSPPGCTSSERRWWLSGVHLPGIGYIPPDVMQSLITTFGTTISTALIDSDRGILLSYLHNAYVPPTALKALVRARDGRCRFFGCTMPAVGCDLDHVVPYAASASHDGRTGSTSGENLAPLCRRHHRAKQHRAWTYLLDPDTGVAWWTNAITGAWRTTIPTIAIGATEPVFADTDPPPEDGIDGGVDVDDRVRVNGHHRHTRPQLSCPGDALSPGATLAIRRKKIPDPTDPPPF